MTSDGPYLPSYVSPFKYVCGVKFLQPPLHPSKITSILQVFHSGLAGRRITGPKFPPPRHPHNAHAHIHTTLLDTPLTHRGCWFLPYRTLSFCPCWKLGSRKVGGWCVGLWQRIRWEHLAGFALKEKKVKKKKKKTKIVLFFWARKKQQTKRKKKSFFVVGVVVVLLFLVVV